MKAIKKIIWQFLNFLGIGGMVQLQLQSGLKEDGWFKSFHKKQSINRKGEPIPWNNYSFLKFIEPRLQKTFEIFEYGSGNSTIWYAQRVKNIKAVENDQNWVNLVKLHLPANAEVVYKMLNEAKDYVQEVKLADKQYDIVIVDGRRRNDCAIFAFDYLKPNGVMILDNSERADYQPIFEFMQAKGFKHLDFWGMPPSVAMNTCTTIFYRDDNCFGI
jgi:spermidine synthase